MGSSLQVVRQSLDGNFLVATSDDDASRESLASQVIREAFEEEPGFELTRVEYGNHPGDLSVVVAYVNALRRFSRDEITSVESLLKDRFRDPNLHFLIRVDSASLQHREGRILTEWTNVAEAGPLQTARLPEIEFALNSAVSEKLQLSPVQTHFNWMGEKWKALVEVIGPREITSQDVEMVQGAIPEDLQQVVEVLLWRRRDFVASAEGYMTYDQLTEPLIRQRSKKLHELFRTEIVAPESTAAPSSKIAASDH